MADSNDNGDDGGVRVRLAISDPASADFGGYALPRRFKLDAENVEDGKTLSLTLRVVEQTVEVEQVAITSPVGYERVLGADIRAAADRLTFWKEYAIRLAAFPAETSDGVMVMHAQDFSRAPVRAVQGERRKVTPENLRIVADLVNDNPDDVIGVIQREFGVGERSAHMWKKRAKDAGLLDDDTQED